MKSLSARADPAIRTHYEQVAAVQATFTPETLPPPPGENPVMSAIMDIMDESVLVQTGAGAWAYMLKHDTRQRLLREMGLSRMQEMLAAIPTESADLVQKMFAAYLTGQAPPLHDQDTAQLTATLQAVEWLQGIVPDLPQHAEVVDRLEYEQFLEQFRQVTAYFQGRETELAQLAEFTFAAPGSRSAYSEQGRPLVVTGPGGVGKSTLVAKFVVDAAERHEGPEEDFAFCYLDFERAILRAGEPLTLVTELVLQLGLQFPAVKARARELRTRWLQELSMQRVSGASNIAAQRPMTKGAPRRRGLYKEVKELQELAYRAWNTVELPLLLVLDSFERVQQHSLEVTRSLWETLNDLQSGFPRLRTMVVGRADLDQSIPHDTMTLDALDRQAATSLLRALGIRGQEIAVQIFERIGGDPLSLRLAVSALRQEYPDLDQLAALPADFGDLRMDHEYNQGWLYRRYLNRIEDEEVRKLAHPGLVLRRVTPALIKNVLAKPCRVKVSSGEVAQDLFDRLARQASLVIREDEQTLRHRPDVRQRMLLALRQTEGPTVSEIHRLAVAYYRGVPGDPVQRAEEIYHRLWLGQTREQIDKRWLPGMENQLIPALDELEPPARAILAAKLGLTGMQIDWDAADARSREDNLAARAQDALALGRPEEVVALLADVKHRLPGSALYLLETQALEQLGRYDEALIRANEGVFSARQAHNRQMELDLLLPAIRCSEVLGRYARAGQLLATARQALSALPKSTDEERRSIAHLELLTHQLYLDRMDADQKLVRPAAVRKSASDLVDKHRARLEKQHVSLLLDAVEELGLTSPRLLVDTVARIRAIAPGAALDDLAQAVQGIVDGSQPDQPLTQAIVTATVEQLRGALNQGRQSGVTAEVTRMLADGLYEAFPEREQLRVFLGEHAHEVLPFIQWDASYTVTLRSVAQIFEQRGQTEALVAAALEVRPDTLALQRLMDRLAGMVAQTAPDEPTSMGEPPPAIPKSPAPAPRAAAVLPPFAPLAGEDLAGEPALEVDAAPLLVQAWAEGISGAAAAVCRVDFRHGKATGFLVGPDLVLTLVGRDWGDDGGEQCEFVFDVHQSADGLVSQGVTYRAWADVRAWSDADHQLHLLRVDGAPGNDLVPGTQRKRGWLALSELEFAWTEGTADGGTPVMKGQPSARPGRAGAPYCDAAWRVVAVHIGRDDRETGGRIVTWAARLLADEGFRFALEGARHAAKR